MGDLIQPWHLIVLSILGLPIAFVFLVLPFWFICKKAGFSPWMSLLNLIPLGNTVLVFILAFADWKAAPASQMAWTPRYPSQPPVPPQG